MSLFRSLYGKLVAILFGLILLISLAYILLAMSMNRLHLEAVDQRLNEPLARNIIGYIWTSRGGGEDLSALDFRKAVTELMLVNPRIEVYLLDPEGRIESYSAPDSKVVRERVDLAPIEAFIEGIASYPVLGDDPRDAEGRKVFSAARITRGGELVGYLYAVLEGEEYDSTFENLESGYVLRLATWLAAGAALVTLIIGVIAFNLLTRRLRRLNGAIQDFERSDFHRPVTVPGLAPAPGGDEIDQVGRAFEALSARLAAQLRQLEEEETTRRELVANISHDLRTPLATLQGYIETLWMKREQLSEAERTHYLELSLKYSERMRRLIQELFDLAILDTRDARMEQEPFSVEELIHDVAHKFRFPAEKKRIELQVTEPAGLPHAVGDLGLIERVLDNLIDNAIKYSEEGGRVIVSLQQPDGRLCIEVSDEGPGIPEEDLPHLAKRFYRVDRTRSGEPSGVGLGLAIAQKILSLHGSDLHVASRVGAGTRFWFELPVAKA